MLTQYTYDSLDRVISGVSMGSDPIVRTREGLTHLGSWLGFSVSVEYAANE